MSRSFPIVRTSEMTGQELVPMYLQANGFAEYGLLDSLVEYVKQTITAPTFDTTINVPVNGFDLTMTADSNNQWLCLRPAGTLATGTVRVPAKGTAGDGQEIIISSTETITSLTVDDNGATAISGTITTIDADSPIRLKYNTNTDTWYKV